MQNSLVSGDDMRYLVQQTPEALTTIMGQMTSLVQDIADLQNDTDERVATMEKQPWYKKMWMTITGKNKSSKNEIQKNQDKVVGYISEAVSQLYQMNCIDQQVMCSLGNRMNQVYAQVTEVYNEQLQMKEQMAEIMVVQQQTIQALGGFVTKLNEKIESVDNFHMLITEIQQGRYHDESQLYSLCCVLAQLDKRTLEDDRKLNILRDALTQSEIISENGVSIQQYLMDILSLSDNKVGIVYLELCNFRNSFPANLFAEMIETYHFLPKMEKMSKNKKTIIHKLLEKYDLDTSADFSLADVSESFIENKYSSLITFTDIPQIETDVSSLNTESQSVPASSLSTSNFELSKFSSRDLFIFLLECSYRYNLSDVYQELLKRANRCECEAMFYLGVACHDKVIKSDYGEYEKWLIRAGEKGYGRAYYILFHYETGDSLEYLEKAAALGYKRAVTILHNIKYGVEQHSVYDDEYDSGYDNDEYDEYDSEYDDDYSYDDADYSYYSRSKIEVGDTVQLNANVNRYWTDAHVKKSRVTLPDEYRDYLWTVTDIIQSKYVLTCNVQSGVIFKKKSQISIIVVLQDITKVD